MTPEIRKIVDGYLVEARKSHSAGNIHEAIRNGEFALKFLRDRGQLLEASERLIELAGWYAEVGEFSRSTHYYLSVYVQGTDRADPDPEWNAVALEALAEHREFVFRLSDEGLDDQAVKSLEVLLSEFRKRGLTGAEAQGLHNLAWVMSDNGRRENALETYGRALVLWREIGDRKGEVWTLNNMGFTRLQSGDPAGALSPLFEALDLAEEGFPEAWLKVVDNLVLVMEEAKRRKEFGTALRACERLVPAVKKDGRWYLVNRVLFANADAFRGAGRFDEALGVLEELIRGNRRERDVYAATSYVVEVGKTLAMQGLTDRACEVFAGALKDLQGIGDVLGASWAYDAGGRALHDAGRFRPAMEWFRKALDGFESAERHRAGILAVLPQLARCLVALGMSEEARDAIRRHDEMKASPLPDDLEQAFFMEDLERRAHVLASMSPGELAIRVKRDREGWHFMDVPTGRLLDLPLRYRGRHVVFQGMDFRIDGAMIAHGGYWVFLAEGQEAAITREGKFLRGK